MREHSVQRLHFLQESHVGLLTLQPLQQVGQARLDAVDVKGGDLHVRPSSGQMHMRPRPTAEEIGPAHSGCEHECATARWHPVSMKELPMPIRFSTQAANADHLHDDAETTGASEGM